MKPINIALIGECMVELQKKDGDIKQSYGGDTLNTAVYLSRLTRQNPINVYYVTALGTDPFSISMLENWKKEGIKTDLVMILEDKKPGIYYIDIDATGERSFYYWRSEAAARYLFRQPDSPKLMTKLMEFDAITFSGISLAILPEEDREILLAFLKTYRGNGGSVIFDNNYRKRLWKNQSEAIYWYSRALSVTDTALLTFEDELELYGNHTIEDCINRVTNFNIKEIIIKRGAEECIIKTENTSTKVPSVKVENVVDTSAAGDSFNAGFLKTRLLQGDVITAAKNGHRLASTVIQFKGAIIPLEHMPNKN